MLLIYSAALKSSFPFLWYRLTRAILDHVTKKMLNRSFSCRGKLFYNETPYENIAQSTKHNDLFSEQRCQEFVRPQS